MFSPNKNWTDAPKPRNAVHAAAEAARHASRLDRTIDEEAKPPHSSVWIVSNQICSLIFNVLYGESEATSCRCLVVFHPKVSALGRKLGKHHGKSATRTHPCDGTIFPL
jgi:hypothetical protein